MAEVLKATLRKDLKKSTTKALRRAGQVPAVLYGKKTENKNIAVDEITFQKWMRKVGKNTIFSLEIEGNDKHQVLVYDVQFDPIKEKLYHIDFYEVDMESEIETSVPVKLVGEAPAEREGGIISQLLYELTVRCLPADIPEEIEVDISNVELGDTIQVKDIRDRVSVELLHEDDETILTVQAPSVVPEEEEAESGASDEASAEATEEGE